MNFISCKKVSIVFMAVSLHMGTMACKPTATPAENATLTSIAGDSSKDNKSTEAAAIKEIGLLKNVEDSGYPFFTLSIEFPERSFTEYFSINLEKIPNVDAQDLSNAVGKYVAFEYNSDLINSLIEIEYNDKAVLNQDDSVFQSDRYKSITGILSNAAEETMGDLPGEIFITTEEEITEKFSFFINQDIVNLNGKQVTAFYDQRTQNTITSLEIRE